LSVVVVGSGLTAACVQLLGGDEEPRFPERDGSVSAVIDSGASSSGSAESGTGLWCSNHPHDRCWDFDDDAGALFATTNGKGGAIVPSDASSPNAFRSKVGPSNPDSYFETDVPIGENIVFEFHLMNPVCLHSTGSFDVAKVEVFSKGASHFDVRLINDAPDGELRAKVCEPTACSETVTFGKPTGRWSTVTIELTHTTQQQEQHPVALVGIGDGDTPGSKRAFGLRDEPGDRVHVVIGQRNIPDGGPVQMPVCEVLFDNVWFEASP
jgi:hypothetical protein